MSAAKDFEHLVGKHFADDKSKADALVAKGIQKDKIVTKADLPESHRVLPPNSMMTMDFRPERLNVEVDANNVVKKVTMG
ncbi:hypothetical protein PhCBS80983_g03699 [Powellomyces hirtus]|uniref:Uncharacterized protein n=1 Tax=Powellomyces hirtus TaxID=109895 RepID=A0A507E1I3_9FUNG|nr:hypothetical protein PhCBS80983_g03699 [Powellomyces hirtus]